jgi:hypothetical protein
VFAKKPLQMARNPDSGAGADLAGYLHISIAPFRMSLLRCSRQRKEPLHALQSEISALFSVLSASHGLGFASRDIFLSPRRISASMPINPQSIQITPEMMQYIRSKSTDLRVATTCEGPLIFSVKVSSPKPTDLVIAVGERKVYVSSLQAQYLKVIDERMLPRCALEKQRK